MRWTRQRRACAAGLALTGWREAGGDFALRLGPINRKMASCGFDRATPRERLVMTDYALDETLIVARNANLSETVHQHLRREADKRCGTCKNQRWRLTKRQVSMGWQIWLQCVECGNTTAQAFARKGHPNWQDYPLFDAEQYDNWNRARADEAAIHRADQYELQRAEYAEWTATSPQWKAMRKRVMVRANHTCEACLERPASDVHHQSYDFGKLPPAYYLVAFCHLCHERLHTEGNEWGPSPRCTKIDDALPEEDLDGEIPYE